MTLRVFFSCGTSDRRLINKSCDRGRKNSDQRLRMERMSSAVDVILVVAEIKTCVSFEGSSNSLSVVTE